MKLAASLQQCLKGDHKAFEPIVLHFEHRVFGLLYALTGSVEDARDLTQDTFIRAWRRLDQYDPERAFAPWVLTIARNLYRDHMRRPLSTRNVYDTLSPSEADSSDTQLIRFSELYEA